MTEREKHLALVLAVGLAVLILAAYILLFLPETTEEPAPEPQTETVDTVNQVEAEPPCSTEEPVPAAAETSPAAGLFTVCQTVYETFPLPEPVFIDFEYENYLDWRHTYPEGYYDFLIPLGRWRAHGIGTGPSNTLDPMMERAADVAYATYCCQCWVRLSGFPGSEYCQLEKAQHLVKTCLDNGVDWRPALAIIGFESTYGLAGGSNDFGILWGPGRGGQVEDYIHYLQHFGIDGNDPAHIARNYNPSPEYKRNLVWVTEQIRGEAY